MPRITKEDATRLLGDVSEDHSFWCCDQRILKNMRELADALATMTDGTYAYHSNGYKDDFSNWVNDVIGDAKLARDLAKSANRKQAAKRVEERISFLAAKLA